MPSLKYFQAGGSLPGDIPSYIKRKADEDLYNYLKQGDFCYVLTARQMGKSSLKVRTMDLLKSDGWNIANIDLTAFGTKDFTTEQWYFSFLYEIADALDLEEVFDQWWEEKSRFTAVARMSDFWEEIIINYS